MARLPISSGRESVYRTPSRFITAMKSMPEPRRAASASGWSSAVGFAAFSAAGRPGAWAKASAAASERLRASRSLSYRDWTTSATAPAPMSSSTITAMRAKT